MNLIYATIISIFALTTTTPTPPPPTPTPTPVPQVAVFASVDAPDDDALQAAAEVVEARLKALGVDYVSVSTSSETDAERAILVEIDAENLTPRVIELLTQPGYLELVDASNLELNADTVGALIWTTGQEQRLTALADSPAEPEIPEGALLDPDTDQAFETVLDGTAVTSAEVLLDDNSGLWLIEVTLSDEGAAVIEAFSAGHVGDALAIVVDGAILSLPVLQSEISSPLWLQGNYTEAEVRELAAQLGSGPLPVSLEFAELRSASDE